MNLRNHSARLKPGARRPILIALAGLIGLTGLLFWLRATTPTYASRLAQQVAATETPAAPAVSQLLFVPDGPPASAPRALAGLEPLASKGGPAADLIPAGCEPMGLHAAPRGPWVAVELACGEASVVRVSHSLTGEVKPVGLAFGPQAVFLGWSPNGQYVLVLRDALSDAGAALVRVADGAVTALNVPGDVYHVALSPDGTQMVYSLTRGLGYGSETWLANIDGGNPRRLLDEPRHIIAFARFAPDGQRIAFIRMPDSNVPFTVGELWVMRADGGGATLIGPADAGHGYAPVWSPDGTRLAYVQRENDADIAADQAADRLASNVRVADVESGAVEAVTAFTDTLVEAPVWSPDGAQLAFAVRPRGGVSDVWVYTPGAALTQVTQNAGTRYPVFTSDR